MENLLQDLRYATRTLLRAPGFSLVVIISIALGFAANATVFSVANGLLWGVLPVKDPGRVVMFSEGQSFSYPDYIDYREQTTDIFEGGVAAHFPHDPCEHRWQRRTRARLGAGCQRQFLQHSGCGDGGGSPHCCRGRPNTGARSRCCAEQ